MIQAEKVGVTPEELINDIHQKQVLILRFSYRV